MNKTTKTLVMVLSAAVCLSAIVLAQSGRGHFSIVKAPLSEAQTRGKGLFLQRCSICHLPQLPGRTPSAGPVLDTVFRSASAEKEAMVRKSIVEGLPGMPAFRYNLQPGEIDDIIAYLKAVNAPGTPPASSSLQAFDGSQVILNGIVKSSQGTAVDGVAVSA